MFLLPVILLVQAVGGDGITPEEFRKLHESLRPKAPEAWQTIPWKTDLLEARALAVQSRRPLFLWSMNGHPLGCV